MSSSILNSPDVLAELRQRKRAAERKLQASRRQMTDIAASLTGGPLPKATSRVQSISRILAGGLAVYQGYRLCSAIAGIIRSLFMPRKRRRR